MQDVPCWSAGCFSNTPPLLSVSLRSCHNDDPRHTFNHSLHCPFNNYSSPLHNLTLEEWDGFLWLFIARRNTLGCIRFFSHKIRCANGNVEILSPMAFPPCISVAVSRKLTSTILAPKFDWRKVEASDRRLLFIFLLLKCHSLPLLQAKMNYLVTRFSCRTTKT